MDEPWRAARTETRGGEGLQELRLRKVTEQDSKLSSERAAAGGRTVTVLQDLAAGEAPRGRELSGQRSGSGCSTTESWNTKS